MINKKTTKVEEKTKVEETTKVEDGLLPLPRDPRDYPLGAITKLPELNELPAVFSLGEPTILDQEENGDLDYCTAYSTCAGAKFQDGVELYPPYVFAASRPEGWGQDLRSMMKAWQDNGCAEKRLVPKIIQEMPESERRKFETYPIFVQKNAMDYVKPSFFAITGPYDMYDNIKASIWHYRKKQQVVYFGLQWHWPLTQFVLDDTAIFGNGHAMYIIDWDNEGLIAVNSYGNRAGRNGTHRITRQTINYYAPIYGCYMMTDIPKEEAQLLLKKKLNLWEKILLLMKKWIEEIMK